MEHTTPPSLFLIYHNHIFRSEREEYSPSRRKMRKTVPHAALLAIGTFMMSSTCYRYCTRYVAARYRQKKGVFAHFSAWRLEACVLKLEVA